MNLFCLIAIVMSLQALALETDNYLVWKKKLQDSSSHIDRFFREGIQNSLRKISGHENKSCEEMTELIAEDFASFMVHDNPVENWLFDVLTAEEILPTHLDYVQESIYQEPYRFYIPWFGLAPNIQANEYYFGTDKLSHFASTGMTYFKIFRRERKKGKTLEAAETEAIDWGIRDEKTIHGYWASGVFSYADLEANYQGLLFYRRFCQPQSPYLRKGDHEWFLAEEPTITDYVSGRWDESFELSYRLPKNWENVAPILRLEYCDLASTPLVSDRHSYYRKSARSRSSEYLDALKSIGKLPTPQSFRSLCLPRNHP